jgi:hypothetical protein
MNHKRLGYILMIIGGGLTLFFLLLYDISDKPDTFGYWLHHYLLHLWAFLKHTAIQNTEAEYSLLLF